VRQEKGFTLIELMVVLSILGILVAVALPNMNSYMDKRKVINAAESIYSQIVYARSEAISRSTEVSAVIDVDGSDWALGVTDKTGTPACDPNAALGAADDCTLSVDSTDVLKRILGSDYPEVTVTTNNTQITFNPQRGTGESGTVTVQLVRSGTVLYELQVVSAVIGRIRICTPSSASVGGYATCS
jgi:prepilin-type N-terminal cleavage/methylation domain-containing protein